MSYNVLKLDSINMSKIKHDSPKKINTHYQSNLSYKKDSRNRALMLQTPKIRNKTNFKETKNTIECEIPKELYDFLIKLDETNIEKSFENSKSWFKQEIPKEKIEEFYKSSVKPLKESEKPMMKVKIPYINEECQTKIYDNHRKEINLNDIPENVEVILVLHISSIRFLRQQFYMDIYVTQIKVCYKKESYKIPTKYTIQEDENDFALNPEETEELFGMREVPIEESDKTVEMETTDNVTDEDIPVGEIEVIPESVDEIPVIPETSVEILVIPEPLENETPDIPESVENLIETESPVEKTIPIPVKQDVENDSETIIDNLISTNDIKKEKLQEKLRVAEDEYQWTFNIYKEAENLCELKKQNLERLKQKLNNFN